MTTFLAYTIVGIATGCIYALTASGLVVTYTTTGIFNVAHGAVGMIMAFAYWELSVQHGWPEFLALVFVLGVIAPVFGVLLERFLMRRLHGATTSTQLVVTLGLLLTLLGLASTRWDPAEPRVVPELFAGNTLRVAGVIVTYHQLVTIGAAILVATFLRLLFRRTRIGIAMRAVVDDPELAGLNGADQHRVAQVSWAMGASLAGLAGILLAPLVSLDIILLTLLVVNGYAAAMVGRLRSLPLTFAGALVLGLGRSYVIGNLPTDLVKRVEPALPIVLLYVVLLVLPQTRLRAGRLVGLRAPGVADLRTSLIGAGAFIVVALMLSRQLSISLLATVGGGVVLGLIMLSLTLLTGYAGQVSLAQMSFVGIGAFIMGKAFGGASVLGIVAAVLVTAAVGAVAALPALRLQGLYLALSTLAFAQAASRMFFEDAKVFGFGGRLAVGRPSILGLSFEGDRAYFVLVCMAFALTAIGVLALRRSPFGRRLIAMRDSPAACATLGLNLTTTKLIVFATSAAIAGLGGALFGGLRGQVGPTDFEMLQSLVLLLLVSVSGIHTVAGALLGGLTFAVFPELQRQLPQVSNLTFLGAGLGAIALARNPNGWTADVSGAIKQRLDERRRRPTSSGPLGDASYEMKDLARAAS